MHHSKSFIFLLLITALITACKNNAPRSNGKDPALENKRWDLIEMNGAAVVLPAESKGIYLTFEGQSNTFGGGAGCNQCNGMYTTGEENLIRLHKMAVTEMACPYMTLEQQYLDMMDKATHYKLTRKKQGKETLEFLYLYIDKKEVAKYKAGPLK